MDSVTGTKNVWQLLCENRTLRRNTVKTLMHNGKGLANAVPAHILINQRLLPNMSCLYSRPFFTGSASPLCFSVKPPPPIIICSPVLPPFLVLSSLLVLLLAGSCSPFPDLAVSIHPSLDCFLSACVHALHSPLASTPMCLCFYPITLSLFSFRWALWPWCSLSPAQSHQLCKWLRSLIH